MPIHIAVFVFILASKSPVLSFASILAFRFDSEMSMHIDTSVLLLPDLRLLLRFWRLLHLGVFAVPIRFLALNLFLCLSVLAFSHLPSPKTLFDFSSEKDNKCDVWILWVNYFNQLSYHNHTTSTSSFGAAQRWGRAAYTSFERKASERHLGVDVYPALGAHPSCEFIRSSVLPVAHWFYFWTSRRSCSFFMW